MDTALQGLAVGDLAAASRGMRSLTIGKGTTPLGSAHEAHSQRKLTLRGVDPRPDGLECNPTEHSLAVAERLTSPSPMIGDALGEFCFGLATIAGCGMSFSVFTP